MSSAPKRPYDQVFPVAQRIVKALAPYCERIEIAGSIRRGRPMVSDIELVALPLAQTDLFGDPAGNATQLDRFLAERDVDFIKNGNRYKQFHYGSYVVDLFLPASPAHWGSIFTIRTGSSAFSKWLVDEAAFHAGVKFKGGRLYQRLSGEVLETPEEPDVLAALGLPRVPPHHRDDNRWLDYVPDGHPAGRVKA